MTAPDPKAALYARTRRLLAARARGRVIGLPFEAIMRRIRERAQALEPLDPAPSR